MNIISLVEFKKGTSLRIGARSKSGLNILDNFLQSWEQKYSKNKVSTEEKITFLCDFLEAHMNWSDGKKTVRMKNSSQSRYRHVRDYNGYIYALRMQILDKLSALRALPAAEELGISHLGGHAQTNIATLRNTTMHSGERQRQLHIIKQQKPIELNVEYDESQNDFSGYEPHTPIHASGFKAASMFLFKLGFIVSPEQIQESIQKAKKLRHIPSSNITFQQLAMGIAQAGFDVLHQQHIIFSQLMITLRQVNAKHPLLLCMRNINEPFNRVIMIFGVCYLDVDKNPMELTFKAIDFSRQQQTGVLFNDGSYMVQDVLGDFIEYQIVPSAGYIVYAPHRKRPF